MVDEPRNPAAQGYVDVWVPRLIPYHQDLVAKSVPKAGERVLVSSVGSGAQLLYVARAMEEHGVLAATDSSEWMLEYAKNDSVAAEISMPIRFEKAPEKELLEERWDLILNAFGLWQLPERVGALRSWREALTESGRLGLLVWGPPDPDGPFEIVDQALRSLDPDAAEVMRRRELANRENIAELLENAGLRLVRHAVVRHRMEFGSAQGLWSALVESSGWLGLWDPLDAERTAEVERAVTAKLSPGAERSPLVFSPAASVAMAEPAH